MLFQVYIINVPPKAILAQYLGHVITDAVSFLEDNGVTKQSQRLNNTY